MIRACFSLEDVPETLLTESGTFQRHEPDNNDLKLKKNPPSTIIIRYCFTYALILNVCIII